LTMIRMWPLVAWRNGSGGANDSLWIWMRSIPWEVEGWMS